MKVLLLHRIDKEGTLCIGFQDTGSCLLMLIHERGEEIRRLCIFSDYIAKRTFIMLISNNGSGSENQDKDNNKSEQK